VNEPRFSPLSTYQELAPEVMQQRVDAFEQLLQRRRTVRQFSDRPVPRSIIEKCLLAAGTAPSRAHQQPWHFVAISDPETKAQIRTAAETEERDFYQRRAPQEWLQALRPLGTDESVGIATGFLIAAVHSVGLVSLTHTPSPMGFLTKILGRPKDVERPYLLLVVGYPGADAVVPDIVRKPLAEIATFLPT
jgi:iodotyrosine deiodinase